MAVQVPPDIESFDEWAKVHEHSIGMLRQSLIKELSRMDDMREGDTGWHDAIRWITNRIIGDETGCVITAFDRRGPKIWKLIADSEKQEDMA
jgi:hypothetical protein